MITPTAWEEWQNMEPGQHATAVDELVRYCSTAQMTKPRYVKNDMEFFGKSLHRGQKIAALLAAGNVDPAVFDEPLRLNLTRHPNRHLGWGGGPHLCLGLHLAKAETEIALQILALRWPDLAIADNPRAVRWNRRVGVRGLETLPLRYPAAE